jgi:mono/diheme cytochrome c family protein
MALSFKGRRWPLLLSAAGFAAFGAAGLAQGDAPEAAPPAVREQVAHGMELYQANCASCHGDSLDGGQFAQSLADSAFRAK